MDVNGVNRVTDIGECGLISLPRVTLSHSRANTKGYQQMVAFGCMRCVSLSAGLGDGVADHLIEVVGLEELLECEVHAVAPVVA